MEKKHIATITVFEVFLCLFVILIHVSAEGVSTGDSTGAFARTLFFLNRALSFVVPAFIFASALKLTLMYKDTKVTINYYTRRFVRIYCPYVVWVVIYYSYFLAQDYVQFSLLDLATYIFNGTLAAHFYFVVILLQFYILMPVFLFLAQRIPVPAGLVISVALMYIYRFITPDNLPVFGLLPQDRWFLGYLVFWMMGVYCALNYEAFTGYLKKYRIGILVFCAAVFLPHLALSYANYIGLYYYSLYETVQILFGGTMLFGFYLLCTFSPERFDRLLGRLGQYIYFVFLSHILVLFAVEDYLLTPYDWLLHRFLLKLCLVCTVPLAAAFVYAKVKQMLFTSERSD